MTSSTKKTPAKTEVDPLLFESRVIESNLHCDTAEGEIVLPLLLKTKTFRAMAASGLNDIEQLIEYVVIPAGGKRLVDKIEELDISVTARISSAWFTAVSDRQRATLGESFGS